MSSRRHRLLRCLTMSWRTRRDRGAGETQKYEPPHLVDVDRESNLAWNRTRWGQRAGWETQDHYGYRWGGGHAQTVGDLTRFADKFLRPWTCGRYDLNILELSPGAGRFSCELLRYAARMTLVDMSPDCIEVCRERFRYLPT